MREIVALPHPLSLAILLLHFSRPRMAAPAND